MVPPKSVLLIAAFAAGAGLMPSRAQAQWWSRAPADFEECADKAEKAATRDEKASQLVECNAKFAGRRKPAGGYTYFDFMQNRSFDIAGPNPTPEEQKKIDEAYTHFLDQERQNRMAAEAKLKARAEQQLLQPASLQTEKVPPPVVTPRPRPKGAGCAQHSFSCDWPRLSDSLKDLKKLFSSQPNKSKRG
jgi:hypothetical protein